MIIEISKIIGFQPKCKDFEWPLWRDIYFDNIDIYFINNIDNLLVTIKLH